MKSNDQKVPKQAEAKRDGNKPTNLQFQYILNTENVDALQTLQINQVLKWVLSVINSLYRKFLRNFRPN